MSTSTEQVEARTLSGLHIGKMIALPDGDLIVRAAAIHHEPDNGAKSVKVLFHVGPWYRRTAHLDPSDLVTVTDGGAE